MRRPISLVLLAVSLAFCSGEVQAEQSDFDAQFNYEERTTLEVAALVARDVEFLKSLASACPEAEVQLPASAGTLDGLFTTKFKVAYQEYLELLRPMNDFEAVAERRAAGLASQHDCRQSMLDPAIWEAEFAIPANLDQLRDSESLRRSLEETHTPRKTARHAEWLNREAEGKKQRLAEAVIYSSPSIVVVKLTSIQEVPAAYRRAEWQKLAKDHPVVEVREGWKRKLPRFIAIRPTLGSARLGQSLVVVRFKGDKYQFVPVLPEMIPVYLRKLGDTDWQHRPLQRELDAALNQASATTPILAY